MKKDDIKAILIVTCITLFFPVIGIISYINTKDLDTLIPFLAMGLGLGFTFGIIIYLEQKRNYVVKKLKKTNSYIYADIIEIEYEDESEFKEFRLHVKINSKGEEKTLFANYDIKNFDVIKMIQSKMEEKDIHDIKVWIDINNYKEFEIDLKDLLERLNILTELRETKAIPVLTAWGNSK